MDRKYVENVEMSFFYWKKDVCWLNIFGFWIFKHLKLEKFQSFLTASRINFLPCAFLSTTLVKTIKRRYSKHLSLVFVFSLFSFHFPHFSCGVNRNQKIEENNTNEYIYKHSIGFKFYKFVKSLKRQIGSCFLSFITFCAL